MFRETVRVGERDLTFEHGEIAPQAGGAVLVGSGDTMLLATVTRSRAAGSDFITPLTVDYRLRYSAAGRIPGSYERRESRPTEPETLTSRLIDRSLRPLFPDGWRHDTQVIVQPLSFDGAADPEVLAISAAAAALLVSDIPWRGPVAGLRLGRIDGQTVVFPAPRDLQRSDLDLVVTLSRDGVVMVEGGAREVAEEVVLEALAAARTAAAPLLDLLDRLGASGRPKMALAAPAPESPTAAEARRRGEERLRRALAVGGKEERHRAVDEAVEAVLGEIAAAAPAGLEVAVVDEVRAALGRLEQDIVRGDALAGRRIGGRGPADIRPIAGRVGWLKRCHGSSLFTRGETQAVVTCTLGGERDARSTETLDGQQLDRFLLHYNFPPYSVGEVRPMRGPGRREVGHGNLARRALLGVLPPPAELPYTVRLESLITSSNGSSSMATVCGATLALHDAGIALKRPVAGIAMGLVQDGDRFVVLSDILGDEDHVGDMDFKVCGTSAGITAIQLDNKLGSLDTEVMRLALDQARQGRLHILERMAAILPAARPELSPHAPRTLSLAVEPNRVGGLIGSGGRTIKGLQSDLGVSIDVGDDGQVRVSARDQAALARAADRIRDLCDVPRVGEVYQGVVVGVQPFGAFVRLFEGVEGLVADPSLGANARLKVRVTGVNNRGRLVLERA